MKGSIVIKLIFAATALIFCVNGLISLWSYEKEAVIIVTAALCAFDFVRGVINLIATLDQGEKVNWTLWIGITFTIFYPTLYLLSLVPIQWENLMNWADKYLSDKT